MIWEIVTFQTIKPSKSLIFWNTLYPDPFLGSKKWTNVSSHVQSIVVIGIEPNGTIIGFAIVRV